MKNIKLSPANTATGKIERNLLKGKQIHTTNAYCSYFNTNRIPNLIFNLKKKYGDMIKTETYSVPNAHGGTSKVAKYWMDL